MPTASATPTVLDGDPPTSPPLTAHAEDQLPVCLFTQRIDAALLEALQIDELGRRAQWVPAAHLL